MGQPYVGMLLLVPYNFAPVGWAFCRGQMMQISENDTLFALIGTTYGGDGQTTFGLPDLQGRTPIHVGSGYSMGQKGGVESVTLTTNQMPAHSHTAVATTAGQSAQSPANNLLAVGTLMYATGGSPNTAMNAQSLTAAGGSQPHENRQPFLALNWIISLYGIYPTPN